MAGFRRRRWREGMAVRVDVNGLVAATGGVDGLAPGELADLTPRLTEARALLAARRAAAGPLVPRRDVLEPVLDDAETARAEFDTLVVLGTGTLARAVGAVAAALPGDPGTGLRLVAAESIDPRSVHDLLARLDPRRTLFDVVSRSGESPETLAQFLIVRDRLLRDLGALDYKRHLLVTTDPEHGPLRQIVNDEGFRSLPAAADLPAGWALLSPAGLFPLAAAGVDVEELLAGAAFLEGRSQAAESPLGDPPLLLAGLLARLGVRGGSPWVELRPFSDRLAAAAAWFRELWGEVADGDGARLPVVLFVRVEDHGAGVDVPAAYQDLPEVGYLGGHSLGELCNAQQQAAEAALAWRRRPSATLTLPALNPFTMGELVVFLQTLVVARDCLAGRARAGEVVDHRRLVAGLLGRSDLAPEGAQVGQWLAQKDPRLVL
jgi:glucose-6-phosphate isomerase